MFSVARAQNAFALADDYGTTKGGADMMLYTLRVTFSGQTKTLQADDDQRVERDYFLDKLRADVGDVAEEQLDTAISWGRFAELFGFDSDTDQVFLES